MGTDMTTQTCIKAIRADLPEQRFSNETLCAGQEYWSAEKIFSKTGISSRAIAADDETAADLAFQAADQLLKQNEIDPSSIELLVFCTQCPDYLLPTSACILQDRLNIATTCAAFDINLGCSGYVYGLSIAKGMMETNDFSRGLLLTGDTYSKYLADDDRSTRSIFGDGASATLLESVPTDHTQLGPFVFGTDGSGAEKLILRDSGVRKDVNENQDEDFDCLHMSGADIFVFTLSTVPKAVKALLEKSDRTMDDVDLFVFHQANGFMLEHLRRKCDIPPEKFVIDVVETGNTVSTSIPLALHRLEQAGSLKSGQTIALIGFGVGYSWSGCLLQWS